MPAAKHDAYVEWLAEAMQRQLSKLDAMPDSDMEEYCEQQNIDFVVFSVDNSRSKIQRCLDACRTLRLPYLFLTPMTTRLVPLKRLLLPVTMLEEEVYKAQLTTTLVRRTQCTVCMLTAADYGSKAKQNTARIRTALGQANAQIESLTAFKDSFHLYREVVDRQPEWLADMLFYTASRDYGLDDLIFGPPERYIIMHSTIPVLLVSPRDDLFSLCD